MITYHIFILILTRCIPTFNA